jgi:hypothetical protein
MAYCHNISFLIIIYLIIIYLIIIYIVRKLVLWQYAMYCQILPSMVCIVCMVRKPAWYSWEDISSHTIDYKIQSAQSISGSSGFIYKWF